MQVVALRGAWEIMRIVLETPFLGLFFKGALLCTVHLRVVQICQTRLRKITGLFCCIRTASNFPRHCDSGEVLVGLQLLQSKLFIGVFLAK